MTFSFLQRLKDVQEIKQYSFEDLEKLRDEIRGRIIEVLSKNGGHLASNLGIVELTIALHYVFDSPKDKFIWDVSHQTYVHKILTGRNEEFPTIRQFQGLCGFSNPNESPHDHFHAGHAGTALSLALGVLENRDLSNRDEFVVPIIGDATLTCGMSLEALNNMRRDMKKLIIVLNDNEMSISKNVGAITRILSKLVSNPTTNRIHQDLDTFLSKIPALGKLLSKQGHKISESIKNLFTSSAFFEPYGLSYIGPVDGHDIRKLIDVFQRIKTSEWPILLHVQTKKGQGMPEALKNPVSYHGAKPFCLDTGKFHPLKNTSPTFPKVFGQALIEMAKHDEEVVVITPAMSAGSCLDGFMQEFPKRCFDVGIAEAHSITFAAGLSYFKNLPKKSKKKVFAVIYSTFLQRAFDSVFHDVCLQEIPLVFAIDRAGIAGGDGVTHNGIYDLSFLRTMPNMILCQPRDGQVLVDLMHSCFSWEKPTSIRYPNLITEPPDHAPVIRPLGKGEILKEGKDVLLISLGHMNKTSLDIAKMAEKEKLNFAVVDPIFLKPLDKELLISLFKRYKRVVTIEEHSVIGGLGTILNDFIVHESIKDIEILNMGIPEIFVEHGKHQNLIESLGLTAPQIYEKILSHFSLNQSFEKEVSYDHCSIP